MLYDPKGEVEVKADPLTLESLIAWLEKMPPDDTYDYWCTNGSCLYGQYTHAHGIPWSESGHFENRGERAVFCDFVYCEVACEVPYTFGAALGRARKAVAKQS
jgi:hypothetical protein